MAKIVKISSYLPGIHDLKAQGNIPHPSTSPFVRLHQLHKNKERFTKEKDRLNRRLAQIEKQIPAIEQELERLFKITEEEARPSVAGKITASPHSTPERYSPEVSEAKKNRAVLEY